MFQQQIFRKASIEKMTVQEDLDELLQVNSVRTWLFFLILCIVLCGMLIWGFFGTITQEAAGVGIIRIRELPRTIVCQGPGQVDSVFCKTGDQVVTGQPLMIIRTLGDQARRVVIAPFTGELTEMNVREGTFVSVGYPLVNMIRSSESARFTSEVIFFIREQDHLKLKPGMAASLEGLKPGIPQAFLKGRISFISRHPASPQGLSIYFPDHHVSADQETTGYYEVRVSLVSDIQTFTADEQQLIQSLNGVTCQVVIVVSRQSPVTYLIN